MSKNEKGWMSALEDVEDSKTCERIIHKDYLREYIQRFIGKEVCVTIDGIIHYRKLYNCCCISVIEDYLTFHEPVIKNYDSESNFDLTVCIHDVDQITVVHDGTVNFYEGDRVICYMNDTNTY